MAVFTGNGTVTAPSFTFSSDTDTGFYRYDINQVGLTLGGATKMILTPNTANIYTEIKGPSNFHSNGAASTGASSSIPLVPQAGGYSVVGLDNLSGAGNNASFLRLGNVTASAFPNRSASWIGAVYNLNFSSDLYFYSGKKTNATIAFNDSALNAKFEQDRLSFYTGAQGTGNTSLKAVIDTSYLRLAPGTGGIQFNGDTAAANALNDYEEGTWTPGFESNGQSGSWTYGTRSGTYTKIGNRVFLNFSLSWTAKPGVGDLIRITGLPYIYSSTISHNGGNAIFATGIPKTNGIVFQTTTGGAGLRNTVALRHDLGTSVTVSTGGANNISSSGTLNGVFEYIV